MRCVKRVSNPNQICQHAFTGMAFPQMHMLQRSCMNNHVGPYTAHPTREPLAISDITKRLDDIQASVAALDAFGNLKQAVIDMIEKDKTLAFKARKILGQGRTDAACSACDSNTLGPEEVA